MLDVAAVPIIRDSEGRNGNWLGLPFPFFSVPLDSEVAQLPQGGNEAEMLASPCG